MRKATAWETHVWLNRISNQVVVFDDSIDEDTQHQLEVYRRHADDAHDYSADFTPSPLDRPLDRVMHA